MIFFFLSNRQESCVSLN
uniref:Uncharacterized protein n=1 Tax=Arundo donax TaxID=35708 RepID=A0A0A8Z179_ARUDO